MCDICECVWGSARDGESYRIRDDNYSEGYLPSNIEITACTSSEDVVPSEWGDIGI